MVDAMKKLAGVLSKEHAASDMINYILKAPRKLDPKAHLEWVAQLVAQSEKVYSCYEAGPTGFALHRQLTKLGVENIVIAPTCLDEQGKRVNNDKSDTLQLAGRLEPVWLLAQSGQLLRPDGRGERLRAIPSRSKHHQAGQPPTAHGTGRDGLAAGAAPARLLADQKVGAHPQLESQGPSTQPQEGDHGLRTSALCGSVEMEDRTDHGRAFRLADELATPGGI